MKSKRWTRLRSQGVSRLTVAKDLKVSPYLKSEEEIKEEEAPAFEGVELVVLVIVFCSKKKKKRRKERRGT